MLKKVAITGGLACGKSLASRFFQDLGAYVVSADAIVHQLLSVHTAVGQQVIDLLGKEIVIDGEISRIAVANKVFNDPILLRSLEKIIHPTVFNIIESEYQRIKAESSAQLFIAEIPLLFETGAEVFFDTSIAIIATEENSYRRWTAANRAAVPNDINNREYNQRMASQLPLKEKAKRADYAIMNNGTREELRDAVTHLFYTIIGV